MDRFEHLDELERAAGRLADRVLRPRMELGGSAVFPRDVWEQMGASGLLGLGLPREYGGQGGGYLDMAVCGECLAARGRNMGMAVSWLIHGVVARFLILGFGNGSQRREWLPRMASGSITASLAVSEPGAGAHPKHLKTVARSQGNGYVLDGEKTYLTNGPIADLFVVVAVTREKEGRKEFTAFLVPRETRGLTVHPPMDLPFLRPSPHGGIAMQTCFVPAAAVLGQEGGAYRAMVRPFRELEDALMLGPLVGCMEGQMRLAAALAADEGLRPEASAKEALGRFQALVGTLRVHARLAARMLDEGTTDAGFSGLLLASRDLARAAQGHLDQFLAESGGVMAGRLEELTRDVRMSAKIGENVARLRLRKLGEQVLYGDKAHDDTHG
jgi:alkylation response protein AidB-like acyl-CoA dehydrogenase